VVDTNVGKGFKYVRIIIEKVQYDGTDNSNRQYTSLAEIKFYGHKENDTTRFPVSSSVVKYPHIAMTGYAQRGYVASASSYRDDATYDYRPYKAFNGIFSSGVYQGWVNQTGLTEYNGTDYLYNASINLGTGAENGEWIKLELPRKVLMTSMTLYSRDGDSTRAPEDFKVYGSNDDSNWTELLSEVGATPADTGTNYTADTVTTYYKYFALVVRKIVGQNDYFAIDNIEYYGTEEDLDIVARVGEGLDGKVANFRVYDKYLHEEQALELWDAQKDQFGVATSSVVVHKGHVGIGTTTPEAALTVMDEAHESEEFPPRGMTDHETYMDGHGVFRASASYTEPDANHGPPAPWKVFSKDTESQTTLWLGSSDHNAVTGSNPGEYNGTNQLASSTPLGDWLKIELPQKIKLNSYALKPWGIANRYGVADYPKTFYIYGSNDGSSWELIDSRVNTTKTPQILGAAVASNETITYSISNNGLAYYDKYAIVITKINSEAVYAVDNTTAAAYVAIGEWRLFGTRERGQSTLHDGSLTLTKNLTVPRIGPPLDADDTPRRDRLVVEYNTSTNPTENGAVRDTSGRGLDGLLVGTARYDATEKAFTFPGSGMNVIQKYNLGPNLKGNQQLTASLWFKTNEDRDQTLFSIVPSDRDEGGTPSTAKKIFGVRLEGDSINYNLRFFYWDSDYNYNVPGLDKPRDKWFHLVVMNVGGTKTANGTTYDYGDPSNRRLFLNGVELFTPSSTTYGSAVTGSASALLDLDPNSRLIIGARYKNNGEYALNGSISNFKLYDVALTADEVKRLYDMGRLGNVIAQPVHIAAPLQVEKTLRVPIDITAAGTTGMIRFNTAFGKLQVYNGSAWFTIGNTTSATGGTVTYADGYTIHTFEESDDFVVYYPGDIEYLVVAGGGWGWWGKKWRWRRCRWHEDRFYEYYHGYIYYRGRYRWCRWLGC
jgi:hypothetical protein